MYITVINNLLLYGVLHSKVKKGEKKKMLSKNKTMFVLEMGLAKGVFEQGFRSNDIKDNKVIQLEENHFVVGNDAYENRLRGLKLEAVKLRGETFKNFIFSLLESGVYFEIFFEDDFDEEVEYEFGMHFKEMKKKAGISEFKTFLLNELEESMVDTYVKRIRMHYPWEESLYIVEINSHSVIFGDNIYRINKGDDLYTETVNRLVLDIYKRLLVAKGITPTMEVPITLKEKERGLHPLSQGHLVMTEVVQGVSIPELSAKLGIAESEVSFIFKSVLDTVEVYKDKMIYKK